VCVVETYGSNDTRAVGANHAGLALGLEHISDAHHIYFSQLPIPFSYLDRSYRVGEFPQ
jgi:hypothetical protein